MNQQKVWDKIAGKWNEYKVRRNDLVDEFFKIGKDKKVLDLGCGSGRNFIKTNSFVYGVDFSKEMLKYAKQKADKLAINIKLVQAKTWKLPFEDNFFDAGVLTSVLHCIKYRFRRRKTIKEFYRVLKPGAKAFISVWNKTSRRLKNKTKKQQIPWNVEGKKFYRDNYLYEYDELIGELESVGFKIVKEYENRNNIMVVVEK